MGAKIFRIVSTASMGLTLTAAILSMIGVVITGFYPGIVVLTLLAVIPIASKFYAQKMADKPNEFSGNRYGILTMVNLLLILVLLWMTFVIVHDRVLKDCC